LRPFFGIIKNARHRDIGNQAQHNNFGITGKPIVYWPVHTEQPTTALNESRAAGYA
jgi:hypothetical protein